MQRDEWLGSGRGRCFASVCPPAAVACKPQCISYFARCSVKSLPELGPPSCFTWPHHPSPMCIFSVPCVWEAFAGLGCPLVLFAEPQPTANVRPKCWHLQKAGCHLPLPPALPCLGEQAPTALLASNPCICHL